MNELVLTSCNVKRILVIKLMHYGDVLLTTPLFNTLKLNYPDALIDVLVYQGTEEILAGNKTIDTIYRVDRELKHEGIAAQCRGEIALVKRLRTQSYDLCLHLSDRWRGAFYCRFLNIKQSLGFLSPKRKNFLWRLCHTALVLPEKQESQHRVLNNLEIITPLKLAKIDTTVSMYYYPEDIQSIETLLREKKISRYIVIQPGARWKFKRWTASACGELLNALIEQGETIVLTSGPVPSELLYIDEILQSCPHQSKVLNLAGKLRFSELAVLIERATLFIGVDSVAMHMAAALKTPSVVLFGPSNLQQWHPWQVPHTLIWAGKYRTLPTVAEIDTNTSESYLAAIPVSDVLEAVNQRLPSLP